MKQDLARLWKLYRTVGRLLPGYFLTGTAVACRNYFITLLNVYLGANVATQCAAGNLSGLGQALLRFALFLALFLLFDASASYGYAQTLDRIRYALRSRIYKNILYAPLPAIEAVGQRGELLSRMNQDVETAMGGFQSPMLPVMFLISGVGATVNLVRIHPVFPVMLYVLGLGLAFAKSRVSRAMRSQMKTQQKAQAAILSAILHTHTWLRELRASRLTAFQEKLFRRDCSAFQTAAKRLSRVDGALGLFTAAETTAGSLLMLGAGIWFYRAGRIALADLVYLYALSPLILMMFSSFSDIMVSMRRNLSGLDRIWDLLDAENEYAADAARDKLVMNGLPLQAEHLACTFANGKTAFADLNFCVPPVGTVAVCGPSGAGKSTLARILLRLYPATGGTLTICGQRLETLACASLRQTVTYVTQESALTSESIRANLTVGQPLDEPALSALLQGVRADSWIQTLPQKLETSVRELSGGQRQAVALARALARNTPVYLFDEVFAGIDQQRTAAIMTWLKTAYSDRLFLIITHDPSVMAACDYRIDVGT